MIIKNEDRTGPRSSGSDDVPASIKEMMNPMDFVAPTEFVELPSLGQGYPESHPLHDQETIEIKFMTAKEEDILTSRSLLKKGIAIDRLIQSLVKSPNIDASSILVGDRNAILIKARASAYGPKYKTTINCPNCGDQSKRAFDLENPSVYSGDDWEDYDIEKTESGTFIVTLPYSKMKVECCLLTGKQETQILKQSQDKKQQNSLVTNQMKTFIVSVNGLTEAPVINYFINNVIAPDSRYLRNAMKVITPNIRIVHDYRCSSCDYEEELEVPFGADFFWPDR